MVKENKSANWSVPDRKSIEKLSQKCSATIFRAYDIRGKTDTDLTPDVAYLIGRAIGSEARDRALDIVALGRDCRESSPRIAEALCLGILKSGVNVVDVGLVPTPILYYATWRFNTGSGVMVTGSHNPKEYNGLKISLAKETLSGNQIQGLLARIRHLQFYEGEGKLSEAKIEEDYVREIKQKSFGHRKKLKVIIDCGNGMAGTLAPRLVRQFGHEVTELFCEIDGDFPNHHPDPSQPENLKILRNTVIREKADLGLAFDGDADRLGVVDKYGEIIWPDRQLILFARDVLSREPKATIVYDVKCSRSLREDIEMKGGVAIMSKTGHSFIKEKMKETGALLGGEMSGHIFLKERWYGFDDAIYSAVRFLEIISNSKTPIAQLFAALPGGISTQELKLDLDEGESAAIIEEIQENTFITDGDVSTIDGLRIDFKNSWGLVRASNTTPSLVFRFEGDDNEALESVKGLFRKILKHTDSSLSLPF